MGAVSIAFGLAGVGALATLMALDTARVPHGQGADVALVLGWLNGGLVALGLGLAARDRRAGRAGIALGVLALPLGLVAFGIFALTQAP
ncbi:MAG: hypothetical protein H0U90_01270 [Actinobacteria bacterium]|nr:hypothetical protein [Actinomycetota bacterium]